MFCCFRGGGGGGMFSEQNSILKGQEVAYFWIYKVWPMLHSHMFQWLVRALRFPGFIPTFLRRESRAWYTLRFAYVLSPSDRRGVTSTTLPYQTELCPVIDSGDWRWRPTRPLTPTESCKSPTVIDMGGPGDEATLFPLVFIARFVRGPHR